MRNPLQSPFAAIVQTEVLLNSKRVAPHALMIVFAANAVLWWGWGPAVRLRWATNSDYYIVKHFLCFVVISHLVLAAFYCTVGTHTRNTKIVYGAAFAFYPIDISYQIFLLKGLAPRWKMLLDPMLLNVGPDGGGFRHTADFLN